MSNSSGIQFPDMSEDCSSLLQDLSLVSLGYSTQSSAVFLSNIVSPLSRILRPSRRVLATRPETPPWACWTRTPSRTSPPSPTTTCPRRTCSRQPPTCLWASTSSQAGCRRVSPPNLSVTRRRSRRSEWRRRRGVAASPGTRWFRLTRGRSQLCTRSVFRIYVFPPDLIQLFLSQSVQDSCVDDWQAYQDPSFCSGKFSARSTSFGGLSNTRDENFSDFSKVPSFQVRSELVL